MRPRMTMLVAAVAGTAVLAVVKDAKVDVAFGYQASLPARSGSQGAP